MFHDGPEALKYLQGVGPYSSRENSPFRGVVFLDLKLPNLMGWEILDYLKTNPGSRGTKVFAYTENMRVSEIRRVYSFGADSYVAKPVSDVELLRLMYHFPDPWQFPEGHELRRNSNE